MKGYDGSQSLGHLTLQGWWTLVESLDLNTPVPLVKVPTTILVYCSKTKILNLTPKYYQWSTPTTAS